MYVCKRMPIGLLKHIIKEYTVTDNLKKIMPSESLDQHIDCFYVLKCKRFISNQLIFNDGVPMIVLMSKPESSIKISIDGKAREIKGGWINCGITKNTYIESISDTEYLLIVRFNPISFYRFFEINKRVFKSESLVTIEEVLNTTGYRLVSSVLEENSVDDKIRKIEFSIKSLKSYDSSIALLYEAMELIKNQKGNISVIDISNQLGVNYKWLERKFSNYIGLTPKEYISIQRFIYTYLSIEENTDKDYLSIAVQNGYYDQSHLFRDFKSFVGVSPLEYAACF